MLEQYGHIFLYVILGIVFGAITLTISFLLRPQSNDPTKLVSYECGMEPVGGTDVRINIRFYLYALIFVIFDVEVVFLYPWAAVYREMLAHPATKNLILGSMVSFLGILFVGYIYALKKRAFDWKS